MPTMTAQELTKDKSPRASIARDALISGRFGHGIADDRVRWWLADHGLVDGRELTPAGKAVQAELRSAERCGRHGLGR